MLGCLLSSQLDIPRQLLCIDGGKWRAFVVRSDGDALVLLLVISALFLSGPILLGLLVRLVDRFQLVINLDKGELKAFIIVL